MNAEDAEALNALGMVLLASEEYENAIDTFYQVIKGTRDSSLLAESYNNIGKAHMKDKGHIQVLAREKLIPILIRLKSSINRDLKIIFLKMIWDKSPKPNKR